MTNTSRLAAGLIQMFEGLKLESYQDAGGVWTIGFGHTKGVGPGQRITLDQAYAFFEEDARPLLSEVGSLPPFEAAALVSFGFNCGLGALRRVVSGSIVVRDGGFFTTDVVPKEYGIRAGQKVLPGLQMRRRLEAAMVEVSRAETRRT